MHSLMDFMLSRVRVSIMELFFTHPGSLFYSREITRLIKEEINSVRRELERMMESGLLKSEERGNRIYYGLNPSYTFYPELERMVVKSTGLGKAIRKARRKLGDVIYVMFSDRLVKKMPASRDGVDMLVIGSIVLPELELLVKNEEKNLGREINYAVFSIEEFEFRKARRDPFIMDILLGVVVMVIGEESPFTYRQLPTP